MHTHNTLRNIAENFFEGFPVQAWGEDNSVGVFLTLMPGGEPFLRSNLPMGNRVCATPHLDRAVQVAAAKMATSLVTIGRPAEGVYEVYAA